MGTRRLRWALMIGTGAILAVLLLLFRSDYTKINYHRSALRSVQMSYAQPRSLRHYFSEQGLRWLVHGHRWKSDGDRWQAAKEHREALVKLGYFERREFTVNCVLSGSSAEDFQFRRERKKLSLGCELWQLQVKPLDKTSKVVVCTTVADMEVWDQFIRKFNNALRAPE